jgi:hypothetical protein
VNAPGNFFTELKRPGKRLQVRGFFCALRGASPLFQSALMLVRLDHVARVIENANHSIM